MRKQHNLMIKEITDSDLFDSYSVGQDIAPDEFLRNEMDGVFE